MSRGEVRKRVWFYEGRKREAWGFTIVIEGEAPPSLGLRFAGRGAGRTRRTKVPRPRGAG
jgi:hypothetical protein